MAGQVADHLTAAGRVPDVDRVVQIEMLDHRRQIVGVVVDVVAVAGLSGPPVPAPVGGDHAVAVAPRRTASGCPSRRTKAASRG